MARGKGEGSIRQRDDGRWEGRVVIDGDRKSFYGEKRSEVVDAIRKAKEEAAAGLSGGEDITVIENLDRWVETHVKPRKAFNTYKSYRKTIDSYLKPHLPTDLHLKKLMPVHVDRLVAAVSAKHSTWVTRYSVVVLKASVRQAKKARIIPVNHLDDYEVPAGEDHEINFWSEEEVQKFFSSAARMDSTLYPLFLTAALGGFRHGELLGLRWEDVNLNTGKVSVRRTLVREKEGTEKAKNVFSEPKTKAAKRVVTVPSAVVRALKVLRARRMEQGLASTLTSGLVFCTRNGTPYIQENVRRSFYRAAKAAGLKRIKIHDLRHTCATLLLKKNEHPKVVQARLGHSKVGVTMDTYTAFLPSMDEAAAGKLEDVVSGVRGGK